MKKNSTRKSENKFKRMEGIHSEVSSLLRNRQELKLNTKISKEVFLALAESVFKMTRPNATPREYANELERQMCAFIFNEPWRAGFIESQFKHTIVSIDYEPRPFYGDSKECEWVAGETVSAFFKTCQPWKELNAEFCRKWGDAFIELVRGDVLRISGGTLTAQPTATPAWQNNKGRIEAYQDFTLVNVK